MLRRLLPLIALLASLPAVAVEVFRENQTYLVRGTTAEEIRASLDQLGPLDPADGQRYDALTRWTLEWHFDPRNTRGGCEIARVWATVRVTTLMPRHGTPSSLPEALRNEWTAYLQRLGAHEEGHARIASDAAREVETALDRLHRPDCTLLTQDANRIGQEILRKAQATERGYDIQTDHGRGQGARFPWTEGDSDQLTDAERAKLRNRSAAPR